MMASFHLLHSAQWGPRRLSVHATPRPPLCTPPQTASPKGAGAKHHTPQCHGESTAGFPKGSGWEAQGQEVKVVRSPWGEREKPPLPHPRPAPNESRALLLPAASSLSPVSQNHSSPLAFAHTKRLPGLPFQLLLTTQPVSEFQAQHWPTCSCKYSWTRYTLSSDRTPDKYSVVS